MMSLWHMCSWLLPLLLLPSFCRALSVEAVFNQGGISGHVLFNQTSPTENLTVTVQLDGLTSNPIQWAVHALPFPPSLPAPCLSSIGPVYRNLTQWEPLVASSSSQNFSFADLTLFSTESIVGRSLFITVDENRSACSNIGYPEGSRLLFAPFRTGLVGDVYLRQHADSSASSISVSLTLSASTSLLQWAILSAGGECATNASVYSGGVAVEGESCGPGNQSVCAVGDLGGKNGNLMVEGGEVRELFTDTNLPLASLVGLRLAIGEEGGLTVCAALQEYRAVSAVAEVTGVGVSGRVEFEQVSPTDLTTVSVAGLEGKEYKIHELPPEQDNYCNTTGGIFDPRGINSSQGGPGENSTMYSDPYIPLSGRDSIIGRPVVVSCPDSTQLCGLIRYNGSVERITFSVASADFTGTFTLTQPAGNPYADTIITVETDFSPDIQVSSSSVTITPTPPSLTPSRTSSSPFLLMPFPSSSSTFPTSSFVMMDESSMLMPMVWETPMTQEGGRRRRRDSGDGRGRSKREVMSVQFNWSLRRLPPGGSVSDCGSLELIGSGDSSLPCSSSQPLSCSTGDLTGKHGPLPGGPFRAVYSDPYLPLSGPDAVTSAVLLIEPMDATGPSVCAQVVLVATSTALPRATPTATPTGIPTVMSTAFLSSPLPPTNPPRRTEGGNNTAVLVGAIVGGVVGAALLLALVLLLVCLATRRLRGWKFDLTKAEKQGKGDVELGRVRAHVEPQIGSSHYRVLYNYQPQNSEDLQLVKGDWVTLVEAPYGGEWWRGRVGEREGWFPKNYVEYVDVELERKKAEEENFKMAAAAIVAASSSFSLRHGSLQANRVHTSNSDKRSTTISKTDIDSTPKLISKFDHSTVDSVVIENAKHEAAGSVGNSQPDTPHSQRSVEVIANQMATEAGSSQDSSQTTPSEGGLTFTPYTAKYNYVGGTDIELPLKKGEMVKVIEKADSGWWQGMCGGKVGWFPASYVKPVPVEPVEERPQEKEPPQPAKLAEEVVPPRGMEESMSSDMLEATEYHALHAFSSEQEGDLQFEEGASILVYWAHENGWWYGSTGSAQGWFPGTYVEPSMESSEAGSMTASPVQLTQEAASPDKSGAALSPDEREGQREGGEGSSLLSDITAALNKNRTKPSEERKEKRKKWSFKRRKSSGSQDEGVGQVGGASEIPQQGERTLETEVKGEATAGEITMIQEAEDVAQEETNVARATESSQNHSPLPTPTPHTPTPTPHTPTQPSPHRVRPRRKAPPPPQKEPVKPQTPVPPSQLTPPTSHSPKPPSPTSHSPKTIPHAQPSPSPKLPAHITTQPSPSPKPPAHVTTSQATPPSMGRTYTSTSEGGQQPVAKHRKKRRTTASGVDPHKPRRQPPPPPPSHVPLPSTIQEVAVEDEAKKSHPSPAESRPVAPPRRKPKVKKVKRPATRLIPPPPSAPLPLPPVRKIGAAPLTSAVPQGAEGDRQPETATAGTEEGAALPKAAVKSKPPPVKPKPAHLAKMIKRRSEPSLGVSEGSSSPHSSSTSTAATPTPTPTPTPVPTSQNSPRPLPPARSSSLSDRLTPLRRHQTTPTLLPPITDTKDEPDRAETEQRSEVTVGGEVPKTPEVMRSLRSAPPQHPPPPRPRAATQDEPRQEEASGKSHPKPPSIPAPQRPGHSTPTDGGEDSKQLLSPTATTVSRSSSIKAKGTSLMRSLKKMVRRSESREEDGQEPMVTDESKPKPQRPTQPPRHREQQVGEVIENLMADSQAEDQNKSSSGAATAPPARPPPPNLTKQASSTEGEREKVAPSRPPPPRTHSQTATSTAAPSPLQEAGSQQPAAGDTTVSPSSATEPDQSHPSPLPHSPSQSPAHSTGPSSQTSPARSNSPQIPTNFYRATKDYVGKGPTELTLHVGDILIEIDRPTEAQHYGMLDDGTTGLFPADHVEPLLTPSKKK